MAGAVLEVGCSVLFRDVLKPGPVLLQPLQPGFGAMKALAMTFCKGSALNWTVAWLSASAKGVRSSSHKCADDKLSASDFKGAAVAGSDTI